MDIFLLCERFCDHAVSILGYSKATTRRHRHVIHAFTKFTGVTVLEGVTDEKVRWLFYYGRTERKWSVQTYIVYRVTLLVFFRWCMKHGYMDHNPVDEIEIPKPEKKLPKKLTKQDALGLLEIINNYPYDNTFLRYRNYAMFATFIFAGLRKQELLALTNTDVDIENFTIFVRQGKGSKDRVVPISYTLAQSLKKYAEARHKLGRTCPEFFTSSKSNIGFTSDDMKRLVKQISRASGVPFTVHKLRHTFATLMLEGGCDIYSLSKMMGHSDIKTTTIYLSASAEHLRAQMIKHPMNDAASGRMII